MSESSHEMPAYFAEALVALGCSWVGATLVDTIPHDFEGMLLFAVAALLPNKLGVRSGVQAGGLYAPILVGHYSQSLRWPESTRLSQGFVESALALLTHQRLVCGIVGGVVGAMVFLRIGRDARLIANIGAGIAGAVSVTWVSATIFFVNAAMMTTGHPSRFLWLLKGFALGTILAIAAGAASGIGQWIAEQLGHLVREG